LLGAAAFTALVPFLAPREIFTPGLLVAALPLGGSLRGEGAAFSVDLGIPGIEPFDLSSAVAMK
jgi:hypothetical protein